MTYFVFETKDGPRLVLAKSRVAARKHIYETSGYILSEHKATTDDMAELAQRAGGLVVEEAEQVHAKGSEKK